MEMPFNAVALIEEVKKRPGLWSAEEPAKDREEKLALWKEVGAGIYSDWEECSKATAYDRVIYIQRKWRSLRDAYSREIRSRRSGVRQNKRVYMYFNRMRFLGGDEDAGAEELVSRCAMESSDPCQSGADEDPLNAPARIAIKKPKKRKIKIPSVRSDSPQELEVSFPEVTESEGEGDKLFLMSFVPELRQLPLHIKMWARAQIANVMQEAVACHYANRSPTTDRSAISVKVQRRDSSE